MQIQIKKTGEILDVRTTQTTQTKRTGRGPDKVVGYVTAKGVFSPGEITIWEPPAPTPAPDPSPTPAPTEDAPPQEAPAAAKSTRRTKK